MGARGGWRRLEAAGGGYVYRPHEAAARQSRSTVRVPMDARVTIRHAALKGPQWHPTSSGTSRLEP